MLHWHFLVPRGFEISSVVALTICLLTCKQLPFELRLKHCPA